MHTIVTAKSQDISLESGDVHLIGRYERYSFRDQKLCTKGPLCTGIGGSGAGFGGGTARKAAFLGHARGIHTKHMWLMCAFWPSNGCV